MNDGQHERMVASEIRTFYALATASIEQRLQHRLDEAGVTDIRPVHYRVFEHLPPEGARLTDLAQRLQTTKQAIGYLVSDLVESEYLERIPDPSDGRASIIRRTVKGWSVEEVVSAALAEKDREWKKLLGEEKYQQLGSVLAEINQSLGSETAP